MPRRKRRSSRRTSGLSSLPPRDHYGPNRGKERKEKRENRTGKERAVDTRLLEMALGPGSAKDKRNEGRGRSLEVECVGEVFLQSKVDSRQDTGYSRRELAIEEELKKEKRLRESYRRQLEEVEEKERGLEMAKQEKVRQEQAKREKEIRKEIEKKEQELQEREKKLDEAAERLKMMEKFTTRDKIKVSCSENAQERTSKVSRTRTRSKSPINPGDSSRYHSKTYHSDQVKQGDRNIHAIDKSRRDQGNATGSRIVQVVLQGKNFSSDGSINKSVFPNRDLAQRRGRGDRESERFKRDNRELHGKIAPLFRNEERFHRGRDKLDEENPKKMEERLRKRLREKEEMIKQQKEKENVLKRKNEELGEMMI